MEDWQNFNWNLAYCHSRQFCDGRPISEHNSSETKPGFKRVHRNPIYGSQNFQPGVDVFGILQQHDPQYIFHCKENRVDYVAQVNSKNEL